MSSDSPLLSIVIPVLNEEQYIDQTIRYLLAQDYPEDKLEILAVVADSKDRTEEIVKRIAVGDPRVKFLRNPYGFSSGARTIGVQKSMGEIVIFVDGHVYIDNDQLFRNTVRLMEEKQVSILSRPQLLDTPQNSFFQRAVSVARTSWIGHGRDSTIYLQEEKYVDPSSSGASYRRGVFEKVGFFDLSFDACEDVEFNYRCSVAGFRSYTSMKLAVYYYPRTCMRSLFRQMSRYGAGRFRLARKHPGTLSLSTLLPSMLVLAPPLMGLLAPIWPVRGYPCMIVVIAYLTVILLSSAAAAVRHGWAYFFALPAVYSTLHTGIGWGFLREFLISLFRPFRQTPNNKKAPV